MLKKLESFRVSIIKAKNHLQIDEEIDRIRLKLRANNVKLDNVITSAKDVDLFENNSLFFGVPNNIAGKNDPNIGKNRGRRLDRGGNSQ
jgi:hypothetical protein